MASCGSLIAIPSPSLRPLSDTKARSTTALRSATLSGLSHGIGRSAPGISMFAALNRFYSNMPSSCAQTKQFVRTIVNPHIDAISWIEPIFKREMNGWQVWTGSYDKTINILFVPAVPSSHYLPSTHELNSVSSMFLFNSLLFLHPSLLCSIK